MLTVQRQPNFAILIAPEKQLTDLVNSINVQSGSTMTSFEMRFLWNCGFCVHKTKHIFHIPFHLQLVPTWYSFVEIFQRGDWNTCMRACFDWFSHQPRECTKFTKLGWTQLIAVFLGYFLLVDWKQTVNLKHVATMHHIGCYLHHFSANVCCETITVHSMWCNGRKPEIFSKKQMTTLDSEKYYTDDLNSNTYIKRKQCYVCSAEPAEPSPWKYKQTQRPLNPPDCR